MSSPNHSQKLVEESGFNEDEEITLLFDDNTSLKSSKSVLEEISPTLKTALNDFEHDGSLWLCGTSKEAWALILHYIETKDLSSDVSSKIKSLSSDALIDVVNQCEMHGIPSLHDAIDEIISEHFAALSLPDLSVYLVPPYEFQYPTLDGWPIDVLRQKEMVKSERELASFLVRTIKINEEILKVRIENEMKQPRRGFDSSMEHMLHFINEMHNTGSYRLCSFFAQRLLGERIDASIVCKQARSNKKKTSRRSKRRQRRARMFRTANSKARC